VPAAVVNALPLVFLARLGQLEALDAFRPVVTTQVVLREVESGMALGRSEILAVRGLINAGRLKASRVEPEPIAGLALDPGELTVIRLCTRTAGAVAVVDDLAAIKAARHLGIPVRSTPFVLLSSVEEGRITAEQYEGLLDRLLREGYFLAPRIRAQLLEDARASK
jgi:predicted nucleic acid-binding protein